MNSERGQNLLTRVVACYGGGYSLLSSPLLPLLENVESMNKINNIGHFYIQHQGYQMEIL